MAFNVLEAWIGVFFGQTVLPRISLDSAGELVDPA